MQNVSITETGMLSFTSKFPSQIFFYQDVIVVDKYWERLLLMLHVFPVFAFIFFQRMHGDLIIRDQSGHQL